VRAACTPRAWSWTYLVSVISRLRVLTASRLSAVIIQRTWKLEETDMAALGCITRRSTWLWAYKGMSVRYLAR
jgi:hypothetical protein